MMIEVNLLPQELRRVEHTPLPRFLTIIVGTTFVSILIALGAIFHLRRLPDVARMDAALNQEVTTSTQSEKEHDLLLGQMEEVKQRKRAIAEIWRARIIWSQKLQQLGQMMPKFIGLSKLTIEEAKRSGRDNEVGGYLSLASVCAGADVDRLAMFRRILCGDYPANESPDPWIGRVWYQDFASIDATPWVRKDMPDYVEKEALDFTLKLAMKADAQRLQEFMDRSIQQDSTKSKSARADKTPPGQNTGDNVTTPGSQAKPAQGNVPATVKASGRVGQ